MALAAPLFGIWQIREEVGSTVADGAGRRKQSSILVREYRAGSGGPGMGRGSEWHMGTVEGLNCGTTSKKVVLAKFQHDKK